MANRDESSRSGETAMSYETFLVHLIGRRAERVLEPATKVATRFDSHPLSLQA